MARVGPRLKQAQLRLIAVFSRRTLAAFTGSFQIAQREPHQTDRERQRQSLIEQVARQLRKAEPVLDPAYTAIGRAAFGAGHDLEIGEYAVKVRVRQPDSNQLSERLIPIQIVSRLAQAGS